MAQTLVDVRNNVVKIVSANNISFGTGFFVRKGYCVTCHHVISKMDTIRVNHENKMFDGQWYENYSSMEKDVAILRVSNFPDDMMILECAKEVTPDLTVKVWGFDSASAKSLPMGKEVTGLLSTVTASYECPEENIKPSDINTSQLQPWNKKPKISVNVFQLMTNHAGFGLSGAPVWESNRGKIIGMFSAVEGPNPSQGLSTLGYIIPIETILPIVDRLEEEERQRDIVPITADTGTTGHINAADGHFDKGNFREAIEYYDKVLSDPKFISSWINKGKALSNLSKHDKAIECYNRAIEINPENALAWSNKGLSMYKLERLDEAIECYDKALQNDQNHIFASIGKGKVLYKLRKYNDAIECYNRAIEIDPDSSDSWMNKGLALTKLGRNKEAADCYEKYTKISPNNAMALNNLAYTLAKAGRSNDAKPIIEKSLEINSTSGYALDTKGFIFYKLGDYEEAIRYFDKALEIESKDVRWNHKGLALEKLGDYEGAIRCYDRSLKSNPRYGKALRNKNAALLKLGKV